MSVIDPFLGTGWCSIRAETMQTFSTKDDDIRCDRYRVMFAPGTLGAAC